MIRRAGKEDLEKIAALEKICFRGIYSYDREDLLNFMHRGIFIVADTGEKLAGYAAGEAEGEISRLASICVHPDFRRRRVGEELVREFERISKESGSKLILIECNVANPSLEFFLSLGFKVIGIALNYYELPFNNSRDAFLMVKLL